MKTKHKKSQKRILLINPPFYRLMNSHFNGLSLGLCYIASVLKNGGHDVQIYNADYVGSNEYADQRKIIQSYENYKEILNNIEHPLWNEIKVNIKRFSPDIIGITTLTGTYKSAENVARIAKSINNDIIVVVGGTHPTILPIETIKNKYFDYVIRREGEYTFLDIANGVGEEDILGLTYTNKKDEIINNPDREFIKDLDSLPYPARDLFLNDTEYTDYGYIMTGRGCPHECTFCASKKIWGRKVRYRSAENVVGEVKYVYDKFGTRQFYFIDDTFTSNNNRAKRICELLLENKLDIQWICETRVDTLDEQLLNLMKAAGCIRTKIGVESGSERILKNIKKRITKKQIRDAVHLLKKVGIDFTVYLMIGFPGETNSDVRETIEFAKELDAKYYSLSILAPYPGTEIYEDIVKEGGIALPKEHWEYFFHQSKDMILALDIDESLVDEYLSLNEKKGKVRI